MDEREAMISQIEWAARQMRESGKNARWFRDCDEIMAKVSDGVNGALMQELLVASNYCDPGAADLFRHGL